ncbi:hypothetical protein OSB04_013280 [Centaurea solstitialis]|uniref:ULTRAPETALA1/2 SAND domain-containing protein n=1 Tax=Centaurea solstitialis TaxID=347529 RepID=A0AA38WR66_9ASTR|nr:hypothetical protein OSB04_013280 [Centaurea solstitialis]
MAPSSLYATVTTSANKARSLVFDSPVEFVKHGSRTSNVPNWRKRVWILNANGQKVKMIDTYFLKYYNGDKFRRPHNESGHRDQFLRCTTRSVGSNFGQNFDILTQNGKI